LLGFQLAEVFRAEIFKTCWSEIVLVDQLSQFVEGLEN
jgi:hypothetical protein